MTIGFVFYRWINSWLSIIDGVVGVISLGLLCTSLSFKHYLWYTIRGFGNE